LLAFFTWVNLRGIKTSAQLNEALCGGMVIVVMLFPWQCRFAQCGTFTTILVSSLIRSISQARFHPSSIFAGTSVAVLTYIGFDAVSTLSEEVENPRRNILLATVLVCLITGLLSGLEVYAAQLIWGSKPFPSDQVESAFALLSRQAGGAILFQIVNFTLLGGKPGLGHGLATCCWSAFVRHGAR
jgi:putrescine importer